LHAFVDAHVELGADADPRAVAAWVVVGAEAMRQPEVQALYAAAVAASIDRLRAPVAASLREAGGKARDATAVPAGVPARGVEGAYRLSAGAPSALPKGFAAPTMRRMIDALVDGAA